MSPGADENGPLAEYPNELVEARLLGVSERGHAIYYDPEGHRTVHAMERGEAVVPDPTTEQYLPDGQSIARYLDHVSDTVGWAALTGFAEEYREREPTE